MRTALFRKTIFYIPVSALALVGLSLFGLSACGEDVSAPDSSTSYQPDKPNPETSSETPLSQAATSSSSVKGGASSSRQVQPAISSSSQAATQSSEEILNDPKGIVNGSCGPKVSVIDKGGMATWSFYRDEGDIFESILAPFVWTFPELEKTVQGNGMNAVNVSYEQSGTYTAILNVDGSEITCSPLRVQGIPITVKSCNAEKNSVTAGETISWTVVAESDAEIIDYSWTSDDATVTGSGTTATMVATGEMHKKNVKAVVSVTNKDKTVQDYTCESVSVVDPNQVDVVIAHSMGDSSKVFNGGETLVAQYPPNAVNCQMVCGANGNGVLLDIDGTEYTIDYSANITPTNCKDGAAAGTKITVKASMQVLCYVTY